MSLTRIQTEATSGHLSFHSAAVATLTVEPVVGGSAVQLIERELFPDSLTLALLSELKTAVDAESQDQTRQ